MRTQHQNKKMTNKFKNTYRIQSTRMQLWDYSWNGAYFITICTKNRQHFFGYVSDKNMHVSEIGQFAQKFWFDIPNHFKHTYLGNFIIMPNHIHGIIIIDKPFEEETRQCLVSTEENEITNQLQNATPGKQRFQNQGRHSISSIIGSYKSIVSKYGHKINPDFGWHSLYHDHIIRNNQEYINISNYIKNNPNKWKSDCFFMP